MSSLNRRRFVQLATLIPVTGADAQLIGTGGGGWSIRGTDPIEIFHGERRVTAYHAGYKEGLPHFDPVVGPNGKTFTASETKEGQVAGPRGLCFALGHVNGYDFRHRSAAGRKAGVILHKGMNGVMVKGPAVVIRTKCEWLNAVDPTRRVCSDRREFTLFYREDGSLVIEASLELMADAGDLEIGAENEGAWSIGLAPGLVWKKDGEGIALRNSEGLVDAAVPGSHAKWVACQGKDAKGEPVGVAILDHPTNPGFPASWTVSETGLLSANPFTQGDAANPLPRIVPNGESLHFRYRTIFYLGETAGIDLSKAYEAFSAR